MKFLFLSNSRETKNVFWKNFFYASFNAGSTTTEKLFYDVAGAAHMFGVEQQTKPN
jgi:hypothetical protein